MSTGIFKSGFLATKRESFEAGFQATTGEAIYLPHPRPANSPPHTSRNHPVQKGAIENQSNIFESSLSYRFFWKKILLTGALAGCIEC